MNGIRVSVDLPASLKAAAERHAGQDGVSLNQFIAVAVAEKVGAVGAAEYFEKRGRNGWRERGVAFLRDAPDASLESGDESPD